MDVGIDVNVDVYVSPNKVDNWGVAIASSAIVWVGVGFIMRSVLALGKDMTRCLGFSGVIKEKLQR